LARLFDAGDELVEVTRLHLEWYASGVLTGRPVTRRSQARNKSQPGLPILSAPPALLAPRFDAG
jgi:hypothetical protein